MEVIEKQAKMNAETYSYSLTELCTKDIHEKHTLPESMTMS